MGVRSEEEDDKMEGTPLAAFSKFGFYRAPGQFLFMAQRMWRPMDSGNHLETVTNYDLDVVFLYPAQVVKLERKKNLLQANLLATKLAEDEKALHEGRPRPLQKVLQDKDLLVWKALLEKYEYDEMAVAPFMCKGIKLVGKHDAPACYPHLLKPTTLVQEDLDSSSVWRRKAAVGRVYQFDPAQVDRLDTTALEGIQLGFLEGPFSTEAEATNHLGRSSECVVCWFLRPIDNCLEAQLDNACTVSSYLKLQDNDRVTGLALRIADSLALGATDPGMEPWLGKCLGLSKACKQITIHPSYRPLAVIFCHDHSGAPKFYVANSLVFGASAAVYSFNRVPGGLWFILNKMPAIPCCVFYDYFPMFQPESLVAKGNEALTQSALTRQQSKGWYVVVWSQTCLYTNGSSWLGTTLSAKSRCLSWCSCFGSSGHCCGIGDPFGGLIMNPRGTAKLRALAQVLTCSSWEESFMRWMPTHPLTAGSNLFPLHQICRMDF